MANGEITVEAALDFLSKSGKKYIPESDLIAAKKGLESKVEELTTTIESLRTQADEKHQALLTKTAELEEAGRKLSEAQKLGPQLKEVQGQLTEATKRGDEASSVLADVRRMAIHQKAGIPFEELKSKTPDELSNLESALKLIPEDKLGGRPRQSFDGGGGGEGGTGDRRSGRQLIKEGLKARE